MAIVIWKVDVRHVGTVISFQNARNGNFKYVIYAACHLLKCNKFLSRNRFKWKCGS